MAAVNKDGLYSTVEILLMDEPQTVLLDNEYSDYYRISFGSNDALWTCHESGNNILTWADQNVLYQVTRQHRLMRQYILPKISKWDEIF